jgi:hypothetical protein
MLTASNREHNVVASSMTIVTPLLLFAASLVDQRAHSVEYRLASFVVHLLFQIRQRRCNDLFVV